MPKKEALSAKVVKSGFWLFSFQILDNLLGVLRLIVLARILTPTDFGLVGVALLVIQIINTFTETGIGALIVHKKNADRYLNVGWTFLMLRGIVLYGIVLALSPFMGWFFNSDEVIPVVQLMSLSILLDGFANIGMVLFTKHMQFHKQFIFQISGSLADCIVTISLALIYQNVWAVVIGFLVNSALRLILSYVLSEYRPKLEWSMQKLREMNSYGKWIFSSSVLMFLYGQADDLLVGRMLGTTALGYYQLAYRISNLPNTHISQLISRVMFPAYSMIQDQKEKLVTTYVSTLQVTAYLSIFLGALIVVFAYDFIRLFLGDQWLPMLSALQLLTVWGILRSIGSTAGALWKATGTPQIVTKIQLFQAVSMFVVIVPLTIHWGFTGTAVAVVFAAVLANSVAVYMVARSLACRFIVVFREIAYPLISVLIMGGIFIGLRGLLPDPIDFWWFAGLAAICGLVFVSTTILMSKFFGYTIYNSILIILQNNSVLQRIPYILRFLRAITV